MYSFQTQQQLCDAIKKKAVVTFYYDRIERVFYPYAVFEATTGNTLVYGILTKGSSKPLNKPEFRYFNLEGISNIQLTKNTFNPDIKFSINNIETCVRRICVVDCF